MIYYFGQLQNLMIDVVYRNQLCHNTNHMTNYTHYYDITITIFRYSTIVSSHIVLFYIIVIMAHHTIPYHAILYDYIMTIVKHTNIICNFVA